MDAGAFAGGYDEEAVLKPLAQLAAKWKVNDCIAEDNFGDGMFTQLLLPIMMRYHKCNVEGVKVPNVQKEVRIIDALEPVLNSHRLVVDPRVIEKDYDSAPPGVAEERRHQYSLFYQLTRMTKERGALGKDDRIDVLALGVKWFTDLIAQDVDNADKKERGKVMDDELKKFLKSARTGKTATNTSKKRPKLGRSYSNLVR